MPKEEDYIGGLKALLRFQDFSNYNTSEIRMGNFGKFKSNGSLDGLFYR